MSYVTGRRHQISAGKTRADPAGAGGPDRRQRQGGIQVGDCRLGCRRGPFWTAWPGPGRVHRGAADRGSSGEPEPCRQSEEVEFLCLPHLRQRHHVGGPGLLLLLRNHPAPTGGRALRSGASPYTGDRGPRVLCHHAGPTHDKAHSISFVAYVTTDCAELAKLYPEQDVSVRFRKKGPGFLYAYCNRHGLFCIRV